MIQAIHDVLLAYALPLFLWLGWPGLMAGGIAGAAMFPRWRVAAAVAGAATGGLIWLASWLAVAVGLRMMTVLSA